MYYRIDKQWMMESDRRTTQYVEGVRKFIESVVENGGNKKIYSCPCTQCKNMKTKIKLDDIHYHMLRWEIVQSYTVWRFHGEESTEKQKKSVSQVISTDESEHPRMEDLVNDANRFHHFQPTSSLLDNIGEPSTVDVNWTTNQSKKYKSFFDSAKEPLYPSCPKGITKSYAIVKLNSLKTQYGFSDNGVTALLEFITELLFEGNTLPTKNPDMKKMIKQVGMKYKIYDACINDCILYWKDDANKVSCPNCKESRYMTTFNEEKKATKVPQKTLRHFPLISRLRRLYTVPWIADAMTWHGRAKSGPTVMRHPCDTSQWRAADSFDQTFAAEPRNVTLGIATDGFNPHVSLANRYSCWPVIVVPYNLPPSMCMKREFSMLTLLISGPKQPGKDIDIYLQPLIDELKQLWEGVVTFDSFNNSEFTMRVRVLWAIHDYPALGTLSGCTTHGYFACPICGEDTCSYHLSESKKMCYMGHRRFLPFEHKFRDDKSNFNNKQEHRRPPWPLTGYQVEEKVANIKMKVGKNKPEIGRKRKKKIDEEELDNVPAWYRRSIFFDLPYWKANLVRHNIDVMHTEKNITEHLISTIMSHKEKSKDGINARKDLKIMGIKQKLWVIEDHETNKITIPEATFTLNKEEKIRFCTILKNMKVPSKFSSNFHNNVNVNPLELTNMKSHDYHAIMQQLLPVLLQHCYPQHKDLRNAIHRISLFFNILCSKVINREHLLKAKASLVEAMCVLEKHFPPAFFDISIHLMVHLADEALVCGPVRYRWMYPFER